jgi:ABC-type uncharacterized transport system permease subunit
MKVNGHGIRDHLRLLAPLLGLLAVVWMLRLGLSACRSPSWCMRIVSVTVATAGSVLLAALLIHFRRFGGYANVVVSSLLLNLWGQLLIVGAIGFAVLTGIENIYTAPQHSLPWLRQSDPAHLKHIYGQLTFGLGMGTLSGAAVGCLMLWLLRLLLPMHDKESG